MRHFQITVLWTMLFFGINLAVVPLTGNKHAFLTPFKSICEIQGLGFTSTFEGRPVQTQGVVVGDFDTTPQRGFFIQEPFCDEDPRSSDGLFVFLGVQEEVVQAGDQVEVTGLVQENFGNTELLADSEAVTILSPGNPLPEPEELKPPWDNLAARYYFEGREGMRVGVAQGVVVGPTNQFGETWVVQHELEIDRVIQENPAGTGVVITLGGGGHFSLDPPAVVGTRVSGIKGVLQYDEGVYKLLQTDPAVQALRDIRGGKGPSDYEDPLPADFTFSIGTLNLHNLFDTVDDPTREDPVRSPGAYQRHLEKLALTIQHGLDAPLLLGVQEVENQAVLTDLVNRPELRVDYEAVWQEGPDRRGIDVGLLYQPDRVRVLSYAIRQGCTTLVDGLGPDGNHDINAPENQVTCDTDGDGTLDGNRLFSRPPLEVRVRICSPACHVLPGQPFDFIDLVLFVNHWKSKSQDTPLQSYTQPRRLAQAAFQADLVSQNLAEPGVLLMVLGDLNDYPASAPLNIITAAGLESLWKRVPGLSRYSYIYRGVSQVLDYLLINPALADDWVRVWVAHTNADYPHIFQDVAGVLYRASDHDGVVAQFKLLTKKVFLPIGSRGVE